MSENIHLVKRAIIMAAGKGERMRPVTYETPKPLVKVNGVRMIDTVIDALHQNGINEIYIVVGYLKDKFYEWAKGRNDIRLIENPDFNTANNISSLYAARAFLEDCIILDGDQIVYDPKVLAPTFSRSGYNAVWCTETTREWLLRVNDGIITECSRNGGSLGWQLFSISRWTKEDGNKLCYYVEEEYCKGNFQVFWDDVPLFLHKEEFALGIREMTYGNVVEIDDIQELAATDSSYKRYLTVNGRGTEEP